LVILMHIYHMLDIHILMVYMVMDTDIIGYLCLDQVLIPRMRSLDIKVLFSSLFFFTRRVKQDQKKKQIKTQRYSVTGFRSIGVVFYSERERERERERL
jgi:hypothetical protein